MTPLTSGEWQAPSNATEDVVKGFQLANEAAQRASSFNESGDLSHLHNAISVYQQALALVPRLNFHRSSMIYALGECLSNRYRASNDIADLATAIDYYTEGLKIPYMEAGLRAICNFDLARCLWIRHKLTNHLSDLTIAQNSYQEARSLVQCKDSAHFRPLPDLLAAFRVRLERTPDVGDAGEVVWVFQSLIVSLLCRWKDQEDTQDLTTCMEMAENILDLSAEGLPQHAEALYILARVFCARFAWSGVIADINRAIELSSRAVELGSPTRFRQATFLRAQANCFHSRFDSKGDVADINQSILLHEQAVSTSYAAVPYLRDLAMCLRCRYNRLHNRGDIQSAVEIFEEVLQSCPEGHIDHSSTLRDLGITLRFLCRIEGVDRAPDAALERVVDLHEQALKAADNSSAEFPNYQRSLAVSLYTRFQRSKNIVDLDRAIQLNEEALKRYDTSSKYRESALHDLADCLMDRFNLTRNASDRERGITLYEDALQMRKPGNQDRSLTLMQLAIALFATTKEPSPSTSASCSATMSSDDERAMQLLKEAVAHSASSILDRLEAACLWGTKAKEFKDSSEMAAHVETLRLLDIAVAQGHSLEQRYTDMSSSRVLQVARTVATDAAALALSHRRASLAVRLLEQGRSVILRLFGQLRTDVGDLKFIAPELAERFSLLSDELETLAISRPILTNGPRDDAGSHSFSRYLSVSAEWSDVVEKIRAVYGFHSFLQPPSFLELQWSAEFGPVIILNISDRRCDAIVVTRQAEEPTIVPLSEATSGFVARIADAFGPRPAELDETTAVELLREIWRIIVGPVVEYLLEPSLNLPRGSRIWWSPTGSASRLPLHAAGAYKPGQRNLPNLFTSSYTPTLGSLMRARKKTIQQGSLVPPGPTMLVVGQADAEGQQRLPETQKEVEFIQKWMPNATVLEGPSATCEIVLDGIANHAWVHLACHGNLNPSQPFLSRFPMHDGPILLLDILEKELPHAELAVLSACHSAGANKDTPDESLHPAAGMMVAGFRSVVGTMWALDDRVGPIFANDFYKAIVGDGGPKGAEDAAVALKQVVNGMGKKGIPLMQRINLVHFGI